MRLTLIHPCIGRRAGQPDIRLWQMEPLPPAVIAGLTPRDVQIKFYDDRMEEIPFDEPTDLVGISVETYTAKRAYQIASEYRKRGVPVVMGGFQAALCRDEASQYADTVVVGEAEEVWEQVLLDAQRGTLQTFYRSSGRPSLGNLRPNRSIYAGKNYLPVGLVEAGRGCHFVCDFCAVQTVFNHTQTRRPADDILSELEKMRDKPLIFFVDDNITSNMAQAKDFFRELAKLKIRWISQASLTMTKDKELMRLMHASGCAGVLTGIESINRANLKQIHKSWNTVGIGYDEALKIARDNGIAIVGSFILGMDEDTSASLDELLEFAIHERFFAALFNLLTPYPGTDLYDQFLREKRLTHTEWWLDPNYTYGSAVFKPKNISAHDLEQARMRLYRQFYGPASMLKRFWEPKANLQDLWHAFTFLTMNLPASREEQMRFGRALGAC